MASPGWNLPTKCFPRRLLALCIAITLCIIFFSLVFASHTAQYDFSGVALERLCKGAGLGKPDVPSFGNLLSKEEVDDMYHAGSKDSWSNEETDQFKHFDDDDVDLAGEYEKSSRMMDTSKLLQGNATAHFRDNLRPESKYITGWCGGGFTNQFMGVVHLITISILTPFHIPIIPPLISRPHLPIRAGYPAIGDIFDLERWARAINKEMVEWRDVKDIRGLSGRKAPDGSNAADEEDEMACWSIWATANLKEQKYYTNTEMPEHLNLDISYTPVPRAARLYPHSDDGDVFTTFHALAALARSTPSNPNPISPEPLRDSFPSRRHNRVARPDTDLVCYDNLYYVTSSRSYEWEHDYNMAWNLVGKHARWSDRIRTLVRESLAITLDRHKREIMRPIRGESDWREDRDGKKHHPNDVRALNERDRILTKYISIHARHGDFLDNCEGRKQQGKACYPPLSTFERLIEEMEEELRNQGKLSWFEGRLPVIVTSDETDEEWWTEVERYGWKRVKYPRSLDLPPGFVHVKGREDERVAKETYDKLWERMLVEIAIQGYGTGFIGTEGSTMSLMAQRRVEHWQDGVTRTAKFNIWSDWD
ncbi:hypothetical protein CPB86DRAFT_778166 [Serendipita vermifera]|nr:hypothetical protein CPB86DRAFT_778166 [Serendipita vermifera]